MTIRVVVVISVRLGKSPGYATRSSVRTNVKMSNDVDIDAKGDFHAAEKQSCGKAILTEK